MKKIETAELSEIKPPFTIRQTQFLRIFVPLIFSFFVALFVYIYFRDGKNNGLIIFACVGLIFYMWIYHLRGFIQVSDEDILFFRSYNIFAAPHQVFFRNIRFVKMELKQNFFNNGLRFNFYLFIYEKEKEQPFRTLFNGFSKKDQGALIRLISEKAFSAEFDETTENMKKGISPYPNYPF